MKKVTDIDEIDNRGTRFRQRCNASKRMGAHVSVLVLLSLLFQFSGKSTEVDSAPFFESAE